MLSLNKVREILNDYDSPDEKIKEIIDSISQLVEIVLDEYFEERINELSSHASEKRTHTEDNRK